MKKTLIILLFVLLLLLSAAGFLFLRANYIFVGGIHPLNATELDLSGKKLSSPEKLTQLTQLTRLDLRDTGITEEQYRLLAQELPGCEISWSIPIGGQYYPNNAESVCLTELTEADISLFAYFSQLAQVDATACTNLAAIQALQLAYPQLAVSYQVPLDGKVFPQDATALTLGSGTAKDLANALSYLPNINQVDASGCQDYATLLALQDQYPQCNFRYQVSLGAQSLENNIDTLTVQNPDLAQLEAVLPHLRSLRSVTLTGLLPSNEALHKLQRAFPEVTFIWNFTLCGVEVSTVDEEIDLSNIPMENTQAVENALPYFYNLQKVVMCDCGISNEEMDALGKRHPETRFVWMVSLGWHIRLRTDAKYLMPHQYNHKLWDYETANLKYCIDLECIDLGHSTISDVSFLAYMPHMKYLILADTQVSDISAVAGLQELVYAELFITAIKDFSPLLSCPNLRDLNISYTRPKDISVLCQMTWLDNLYMKGWENPAGEAQLRAALPNTKLVFAFEEGIAATGNGWRKLPNYYKMRDLLGMKYMDQDD
jgi:Leucine-rich repeat (LRR) protein